MLKHHIPFWQNSGLFPSLVFFGTLCCCAFAKIAEANPELETPLPHSTAAPGPGLHSGANASAFDNSRYKTESAERIQGSNFTDIISSLFDDPYALVWFNFIDIETSTNKIHKVDNVKLHNTIYGSLYNSATAKKNKRNYNSHYEIPFAVNYFLFDPNYLINDPYLTNIDLQNYYLYTDFQHRQLDSRYDYYQITKQIIRENLDYQTYIEFAYYFKNVQTNAHQLNQWVYANMDWVGGNLPRERGGSSAGYCKSEYFRTSSMPCDIYHTSEFEEYESRTNANEEIVKNYAIYRYLNVRNALLLMLFIYMIKSFLKSIYRLLKGP
jgi:hypothetical protein